MQMDTALQVADALAKLHALNLAHRDLSPRNILRSRIGTFKLGDFGVSRTCRETLHGCAAAAFVGTVAYAAPEDSDDAVCSVTVAADVWAFAATFVEAATGAPLYGDVSWKRILRCHMQGIAPDLEGHAAATPKEVLAACFAMDASARPSAADLLERLLACKPQLCADPSARVLRPAAADLRRSSRRRRRNSDELSTFVDLRRPSRRRRHGDAAPVVESSQRNAADEFKLRSGQIAYDTDGGSFLGRGSSGDVYRGARASRPLASCCSFVIFAVRLAGAANSKCSIAMC